MTDVTTRYVTVLGTLAEVGPRQYAEVEYPYVCSCGEQYREVEYAVTHAPSVGRPARMTCGDIEYT